jgi:hypothetical protein
MTNAELIKTLREGDLIRIKYRDWKYPLEARVFEDSYGLRCGGWTLIRDSDYVPDFHDGLWTIEVLERAKAPFYTNVDRDPVPGDVAKYEGQENHIRWVYARKGWTSTDLVLYFTPSEVAWAQIRPVLVLDGETGEPVR